MAKYTLVSLDIVVIVYSLGDDVYTTHLYGRDHSEAEILEAVELDALDNSETHEVEILLVIK